MTGTVYLVGAGPGAADLLTLRAARLLAAADIVLHDALVDPETLAMAVNARLLNVGKRAHRPSTDQSFINRLLVRSAQRHKIVVRLKGGDPMLFGRAQEEIEACRAANVPVEVVPGVSAGFAAAAEIMASLTHRKVARSVAFVTPAVAKGLDGDEAWANAAAAADSAVVYMGKREAARVRDALIARGVPATRPAVLVESASLGNGRALGGVLAELDQLADAAGDGPALLLIGDAFARAAAEHRLNLETETKAAAS
ncbi:MAG: uroporphyrinogen-III C-methyltransferase [Hyphomonadaceae bacterium]|nr:uroporphyrinogen-III C-methyltransferase [Hyphomonadaceae bacterium]